MSPEPGGLIRDPQLVLCGLSMVPVAFVDLVAAAAAAGFDAVSVGPAVYRRALRDGLSMSDMRLVLDDCGIWVSEVEGVGNWLTPPEDKPARWAQQVSDDELLDLASALGARSVLATHFGTAVGVDEAAAAFGRLCDRVAGDGLSVGLEFVAFATIDGVEEAGRIVSGADRPNGGIVFDTWHYFRGRPDPGVLASLPPRQVVSVQLADGTEHLHGSLEEDILHRRLPGAGSFDLAGVLSALDARGVCSPVGIEVWDREILSRGHDAAARHLREAVDRFLAELDPARAGPPTPPGLP